MSSEFEDFSSLLLDAEEALEVGGVPEVARKILPRLEAWTGTCAEKDARYRLNRGLARYLVDRDEDARSDYLYAFYESKTNSELNLKALCRLAQIETHHEKYELADDWLKRASESIEFLNEKHYLVGEVYLRKGILEKEKQEYRFAKEYFSKACSIFYDLGHETRFLYARIGLAEIDLNTQIQMDVVEVLENIIIEAENLCIDTKDCLPKIIDLAITAYFTGHRDGLAEWLSSFTMLSSVEVCSIDRVFMGVILSREGFVEEAITQMNKALETGAENEKWFAELHLKHLFACNNPTSDEQKDLLNEHVIKGLNGIASCKDLLPASKLLFDTGEYNIAEIVCRHILTKETTDYIKNCAKVNLIGLLVSRGRIEEAVEIRRSLELQCIEGDMEMVSINRVNDALLYFAQGLWEEARSCMTLVADNLGRYGEPRQLALALNVACELAWLNGEIEETLSYLERMEEIYEEAGDFSCFLTHLMTGNVFRALERWPESAYHFNTALKLAYKIGWERLEVFAMINLLILGLDCPDPGALSEILDGFIFENGDTYLKNLEKRCQPFSDLTGRIRLMRGEIAKSKNNLSVAEKHFRRAGKLFADAGHVFDQADALDRAASVSEQDDNAIRYSKRATILGISLVALCSNEQNRVKALARMRQIGERLVGLYVKKGDGVAAASAVYEVKAGEFLRETNNFSGRICEKAIKALKRAVEVGSVKNCSMMSATSLMRQASHKHLSNELRRVSPNVLFKDPVVADAGVSSKTVLKWLRHDEAAVEYFIDYGESRILIIVLYQNQARMHIRRLYDRHWDAINNVADVVSGKKFDGDPRWLLPNLRLLYQLLISPLGKLPYLVKRIWFATGGRLNNIPFSALVDKDDRFLVERIDIRMLVSTAQLVLLPREIHRRINAMVMRGEDFGDSLLHYADSECQEVKRILRQNGVEVVEEFDEEYMGKIDVIHYAGHACFDKSNAIGVLKLPGYEFGNTDFERLPLRSRRPLVVLSACESGVGDIGTDGLTGFIRSAFAAGARDVVCSGWSAHDKSTNIMMRAFYKHISLNKEPSQALRHATKEMRDSRKEWGHPFYWANFRCFGMG